jgi:hypothetical protein
MNLTLVTLFVCFIGYGIITIEFANVVRQKKELEAELKSLRNKINTRHSQASHSYHGIPEPSSE